MESTPYSTLGTSWQEKPGARSRRPKWIVVGSVAALAVLIAVGVAVGVTVSKSHKNNNNNNLASNGSSSGASGVVQSDPNDPSSFTKDARLHQSFYGLAYTPANAQLPNCNVTLGAVIEDIQLMSQLTTRIRLYGADCNQTSVVLDAIQRTKVNMTVYVGNYVVPSDNTAYQRQRDELQTAFASFGVNNVVGMTVGNEFMLNYVTDNGGATQDINGPVANTGAQLLISMINDTRTWLQGLNLPKSLPVGTSDAGSYFNNEVLASIDYGMANVHAWFADQTAAQAAGWVADFFSTTNIVEAQAVPNKPKMYIAETGWPTNSNDTAHASNGVATASEQGLQTFLDTFVCAANANGTGYFFFEFFDEPWKEVQFGGVEGYWGLFTANKTLKNVNIPTC
ncbi:glycoside hydrolase family 17 protein [Gautieria morchelliformis]|nr:glycoside hydrolase family 17 protein [Gautieria morchelliformis]